MRLKRREETVVAEGSTEAATTMENDEALTRLQVSGPSAELTTDGSHCHGSVAKSREIRRRRRQSHLHLLTFITVALLTQLIVNISIGKLGLATTVGGRMRGDCWFERRGKDLSRRKWRTQQRLCGSVGLPWHRCWDCLGWELRANV